MLVFFDKSLSERNCCDMPISIHSQFVKNITKLNYMNLAYLKLEKSKPAVILKLNTVVIHGTLKQSKQ